MGGGPESVEHLEKRDWGLFADYSRPRDADPKTSPANSKLREKWARNRILLKFIAGAGWLAPVKGSNGKPVGGTVVDPVGVATAERDTQLEILRNTLSPTDPDRHRLFAAVWDEYYRKMEALRQSTPEDPWKKVYWAQIQEDLTKQIAEQAKQVEEMEARLSGLKAELRVLNESDGRSEAEHTAGEPAHPPYMRIQETTQEVLRLQEELSVEQRFLKALQEDAVRLETK